MLVHSFKEPGINREPTVHPGSGAGALEWKGICSDRGDINREIMEWNRLLESAENAYREAVKYVDVLRAAVSVPAPENKNEILELIGIVAAEKGRLVLSVVSGKHLRRIRNRDLLQLPEKAAAFINAWKTGSFEMPGSFLSEKEQKWQGLTKNGNRCQTGSDGLRGCLKCLQNMSRAGKFTVRAGT